MPVSTWFPVGFLVLALAGSLTVVVVRGLAVWRSFQSFSTAAGRALDAVNVSAASAEAHAAAFAAATERLEIARARLERSLAELAVLRTAAGEVNGTLGRMLQFVPRKRRP